MVMVTRVPPPSTSSSSIRVVHVSGVSTSRVVTSRFGFPAELVLGRLMYPSSGGRGGRGFGGGANWLNGGTNWTVDYPRGDRFFAVAIRRLTRIDVRSVSRIGRSDLGANARRVETYLDKLK